MSAAVQLVLRRALRYSNWDVLLIALSFAHGAILLAFPSLPLIAMGLWWNANTISHNFVHLPFFRSSLPNRCYSVYLSLVLGFPQSLWRDRHLAHHAAKSFRPRLTRGLLFEMGAVFSLWSLLLVYSPRFFWTVYLPGYAAGLTLCYLHGYFEHAGGATSHYSSLYNVPFFNDGFHAEHHLRPAEHWTRLPQHSCASARTSRWPAVLRWLELVNLEMLETLALQSKFLQGILLRTHERAFRRLLPLVGRVRNVKIVGGGMFPRTAILLRKLLPDATITIVDASSKNLDIAKRLLASSDQSFSNLQFVCEVFQTAATETADLVVIPLCFIGSRAAIYSCPPAAFVLVHDWIWSRQGDGVIVSPWLLKRMNLARR